MNKRIAVVTASIFLAATAVSAAMIGSGNDDGVGVPGNLGMTMTHTASDAELLALWRATASVSASVSRSRPQ